MSRSLRRTRRAHPMPERLEGRALLNGDFRYTTPDGARVHIQLLGPGDLKGTSVLPDGSLDLEFEGTAASTRIYGNIAGGSGRARLAEVVDAGATAGDFSGVGTEAVGIVRLKPFDLIPGGVINLTAGFSRLVLGSTGANSQVQLRASNQTLVANTSNSNQNASAVSTGLSGSASSTGQSGSITNTLTSTGSGSQGGLGSGAASASSSGFGSGGAGGANISGIPGTIVGTNIGGITSTVVTGTGSATGSNAANNTTNVTTSTGGAVTGVGSTGVVGATSTSVGGNSSGSGTRPGITAAVVIIDHVDGAPNAAPALGDAQIYGYDPTANALIRFNARTGAALQAIPLGGTGTAIAGVALGRDAGELVALVGFGTSIRAFDASTGAMVGQFSTASLAKNGLTTVDGIGSTGTVTVVSDSSAGALGLIQQIDVTKSLATGQAVAVGAAFAPTRGFELSGGLTGLAGTDTIYASGAAHFDTFQPNLTQAGLLALNASGVGPLVETARASLPGPAGEINAGPAGTARKSPTNALGSVAGDLALVTGVVNGKNTVQLFSAGVTDDGILPLNDPNLLTGLSESFHPELAGSSLVNVQGVLRRFNAQDARGLVLNISGRVDLVLIPGPVSDSAIVGRPAAHVATGPRTNVTVLSTPRINGDKGDVITDATPRPLGPLSLP